MSQSRFRSTSRSHRLLRIVGVDDGPFSARRRGLAKTILVAVLLEGPKIIDLRVGTIEVDGVDAHRILLSLLNTLSYNVVMLSGVSFGGFNLVDIKELAGRTGKPVIAVIRERPNNKAVQDALREHFEDWRSRWRVVENAGRLYSCKPVAEEPRLYFEVRGASPVFARRVIASASFISRLPEAVRVAGIVAKGLRARSSFYEIDQANLQGLQI